jgi:hypothetical protein
VDRNDIWHSGLLTEYVEESYSQNTIVIFNAGIMSIRNAIQVPQVFLLPLSDAEIMIQKMKGMKETIANQSVTSVPLCHQQLNAPFSSAHHPHASFFSVFEPAWLSATQQQQHGTWTPSFLSP